jgi:amino acid transporter
MDLNNSGSVVFNWFINIGNTSGFISWVCCGIVCLRFRKACAAQGIPLSSLPYTSWTQPWGSWILIVVFTLLTLVNGFTVFFPGEWSVSSFLTAYIGIPAFFACYFGHKAFHWHEPWLRRPEEVDLVSGIAEMVAEEMDQLEDTRTWKAKTKTFLTIGFL